MFCTGLTLDQELNRKLQIIPGERNMNDGLNFVIFLEKKMHTGNCSIQIGKVLLERQSWGEAARAFNIGIAKGNLEDSNEASTLLSKCHGQMNESGPLERFQREAVSDNGMPHFE